jgi:hypothetical protein
MNYIRPRIFVSYSSKDSEIVHRIRRDLEKAGIDCWIDLSTIGTGDRLQDAIFGEGIPQCNVFFAYITENYLESKWCMKELRQALQSRRVKIVPFADSEQTMQKIPRQVRSEVRCGILDLERYVDSVAELCGKAWTSLQDTRRLVSSEDHILAGTGVLNMEGYRKHDLLKRVRTQLILAAPNLRSWLSDPDARSGLIELVRNSAVMVQFILATYETLRPLGAEGAEHLRQSAEDIKAMRDQLSSEQRERMQAFFHIGAATLSAIFIDPGRPEGLLFFTPRWAIQYLPQTRLTCVIDKSLSSIALYNALYDSVLLMTQRDAKSLDDMLRSP